MCDYLTVGKITSAYGINGEVKIFPFTDHVDRFYDIDFAYISDDDELNKYDIETVRLIKNIIIIKFKGINNRNDAEKLKGYFMKVVIEDSIELNENEYFIKDLINMRVFTDEKKELGVLVDVLKTGANDVYVIRTDERDILLPAIEDVIKEVNVKEKRMIVHLLEGL